jgi:hypothetical protein
MSNWEAWEISWGALLIFACTLMAHSGTLRFYHGLIGFFHFILDHTPTPLSSSMFLFLLYSRAVKGLWLGPQGGRFWGYLRPHSVGLGFSDPLLPLLAFAVSVARYRPSSPPSLFLWLGIGRRYLLVAPSLFQGSVSFVTTLQDRSPSFGALPSWSIRCLTANLLMNLFGLSPGWRLARLR